MTAPFSFSTTAPVLTAFVFSAALITALTAAPDPARAIGTTLGFDGLFTQFSAERDALPGQTGTIDSSFSEADYVIDYLAEGVSDGLWPDGWSEGLLAMHDGGSSSGNGSLIDITKISRSGGGKFSLKSFTLDGAIVSALMEFDIFDLAGADFTLHPAWDGPTDVPDLPNWQQLGRQAAIDAGGSASDWSAFYDSITRESIEEYTAYSVLRLTGETEGGPVTALIDVTRNYLGEPVYMPTPDAAFFDREDFGDAFTHLTSLTLDFVFRDDFGPVYRTRSEAIPEGLVIQGFSYLRTGTHIAESGGVEESQFMNNGIAAYFDSVTVAPVPIGGALPMLAGALAALGGVTALRRRQAR